MIETNCSLTNAAVSTDESILQDVHNVHKNIAIYERNIDELSDDIVRLMKDSFEYRANGTPSAICDALQSDFESFFSSDSALLNDIKKLVNLFSKVTQGSSFNLLLATVESNMCRRFHADMNDLRMLCTYSGPGTLWLTEDNINRKALNEAGKNEAIVLNEDAIQQVPEGAAVILKGAIYPKAGTKAAVHRSPSIEECKGKRLLLRLDTNDFFGTLLKEI